jgi:hypothetical protein
VLTNTGGLERGWREERRGPVLTNTGGLERGWREERRGEDRF